MNGSFKRIFLLLNTKALLVILAAVAATWVCRRYNLSADFPLTLIATAVVFPIVFSINGAYKRREVALAQYGVMKAHGRAIYFAARDWLDSPSEELLEKTRDRLGNLFRACRTLFTGPLEAMPGNEEAVYREFSDLSRFVRENLRQNGLATGEVSRCNQYISKTLIAFENVKHIYQYRTPRTLRAFSDFFIVVLPVLYGPHFVEITRDVQHPGLVYVMPILFSAVLVSLDNIQHHLENPFDQIGEDDVTINAEKFVERLKL